MSAPTDHLERTRGKILTEAEQLWVVSHVLLLRATPTTLRRGRLVMALTDRRLLLVTSTMRASRAQLVREWRSGKLGIRTTRPKLGNDLIHIQVDDDTNLCLEHLGGHGSGEWDRYRYRQ